MTDAREKLLSELQADADYGVLLAVQMDGVPNTIQLMLQTARLDEAAGGLRPRGQYVVRALGVEEHSLSVGVFGKFTFTKDHPVAYWTNTPTIAVFFRGQPDNVAELTLDIHQAHASTLGHWRPFPMYLNIAQPLVTLLASGGGLLGEMPKPLAERMERVLQHHGLETKLMEAPREDSDEHGRSRDYQALVIDQGYVLALDYSVDELGVRKGG